MVVIVCLSAVEMLAYEELLLFSSIQSSNTELLSACKCGDEERVKLLLTTPHLAVDFVESDELLKTALHYAAREGNVNNVRMLLQAGANVNAEDEVS